MIREVEIAKIAEIKGGKRLPKGFDVIDSETKHPYLRIVDFDENGVNSNSVKFISEEAYQYISRYTISSKDVYVSIAGTIGRVGIVPETFDGANLTENAAKITNISETISQRFLLSFLRSPNGQGQLISKAGGTSQPKLALFRLGEIRIPLLPKVKQERIADLINHYDLSIENNIRRIDLLEKAVRTLFEEWFVQLRFPGREHTKIKGGVPEGWQQNKLGEICNDIREAADPKQLEPDTPYIGLEHMPRKSITLSSWGKTEEVTSTKLRFKAGEILFGKIRPYFHKVGIAFVDGVASSDVIVIRPNSEVLRFIVLMVVSSDAFVAQASQTMREGSKMPRADWKHLKQYSVKIPPPGILDTFNSNIGVIIQQLKVLALQNQKLKQARDLLLPKLMTGAIQV